MTEPSAETVQTFLRLGFPLLPDRADAYLAQVILPTVERTPPAGQTANGILEGIMGQIEENESAHATHRDLLAGLDARGLTPGVRFEQALLDFPKNPTKGAFDRITQGARVEVHLRIGSVPAGG